MYLNSPIKIVKLAKSINTVLSNKKSHTVDYMTMLFLMVFIFMRVAQYYSPPPSLGRRDNSGQQLILKLNLNVQTHNIEKLLDKGIIEFKNDRWVPEIKFSGILLYVLLTGFLTLVFKYPYGSYCPRYSLNKGRLINLLCSFRL